MSDQTGHVPLTDDELFWLKRQMENFYDINEHQVLRLIADLYDARADIQRLTQITLGHHPGFLADAAEWRAQEARCRRAEERAAQAEAERDAAIVAAAGGVFDAQRAQMNEIERLRALVAELEPVRDRWKFGWDAQAASATGNRQRAEAAEARLSAVLVVCDAAFDTVTAGTPVYLFQERVRAAATGTEPDVET